MQLIQAYSQLRKLNKPVFTTAEVAGCLRVTLGYASKILGRLSVAGQAIHLTRAKWALDDKLEPLCIPELLTYPWPSYVSLYTALFYYGFITQIPQVIYAVSLGRTRYYETPLATFSIHQITPDLFFGFDVKGTPPIKIASPEKTLFDVLYLHTAKSGFFRKLPEIEIPSTFRRVQFLSMIPKIISLSRRKWVETEWKRLCR